MLAVSQYSCLGGQQQIQLHQYLYHFEMQSPIAKQRVRTIKQLQQGLSLPTIPERTPSSPRTSTHSRSSKHSVPCISQAALSPEEEHLQDQIRMVLRNSPKINQEHNKTLQANPKRSKPMLPPLPNHSKNGENAFSAPPSSKARSRSAKTSLSSIMREQQHYVQLYFAELIRRRVA